MPAGLLIALMERGNWTPLVGAVTSTPKWNHLGGGALKGQVERGVPGQTRRSSLRPAPDKAGGGGSSNSTSRLPLFPRRECFGCEGAYAEHRPWYGI